MYRFYIRAFYFNREYLNTTLTTIYANYITLLHEFVIVIEHNNSKCLPKLQILSISESSWSRVMIRK